MPGNRGSQIGNVIKHYFRLFIIKSNSQCRKNGVLIREVFIHGANINVCSFCNASVFEVQGMHQAKDLLLCNRCLDTCVRLLAKEEVERFLRSF
ncbi:MAG TPA: hypothetical protein EYQ00_01430 [Dehalococcoidia bacterium]|nr:hypothetical protein [Dehalococcoidia bacterium]